MIPASDITINWRSSNSGIASVSSTGSVVAVAVGGAVITANAGTATADVPVHVWPRLTIDEKVLPTAERGTAYSQRFLASGGDGTYSWQLAQGTLAPGLTLDAGGFLRGTPTSSGTFSFTVQVASINAVRSTSVTLFIADPPPPPILTASINRTFAGTRNNRWECQLVWTLSATGDQFFWNTSEIQWQRATDGFIATTALSTQSLQDTFGTIGISAGKTVSGNMTLTWDSPFQAVLKLRYRSQAGTQGTASAGVDCR